MMDELFKQASSLSKADEFIIIRHSYVSENIRWANTTTTTNGVSKDSDITFISIINNSVGSISESYSNSTDLSALIKKSEEIAKKNPPSDDAFTLVDAEKHLHNPHDIKKSDISSLTHPLSEIFARANDDNLDLFGYAELTTITTEVSTSSNIHKSNCTRVGLIELNAKNKDRDSSIWEGRSIKSWEDQDINGMYEIILKKIKWSQNKISIDPGKYTVLLEPSAVADLLIYAYWESNARDASEGRTVYHQFTDKNKPPRQFSDNITIHSDPSEKDYECLDFVATSSSNNYESVFDNGMNIGRSDWIKNGTVASLFSPRYWAHKNNIIAKPFVENLIFRNINGKTIDQQIESIKDGLLVTCLWYIREVDAQSLLLTGLTRDGIFVIKNGKVIGAANNFRFNMSPIEMLKNISDIGVSKRALAREFGDYFKLSEMPSLIVDNFNMSSVSEAL